MKTTKIGLFNFLDCKECKFDGVSISKDNTIGAGAIVSKNVPKNTIVVSASNKYLKGKIHE